VWLSGTALVGWALGVAVLTLRPASPIDPLTLDDFLCLGCSSRWGADTLLNWVLFIPGGVALRSLFGLRRTLVVGALITLGIEAAQILLPGRHPSLGDLLFNTGGAATGAWLYRVGASRGVLRVCGAAAAVLWLAPTVLLAPWPTRAQLYANWTPDFAGQPTYDGEVLAADIAGIPLRYRVEATTAVRDAILRRARLTVDFVVAPDPAASTFLFGLWDEDTAPDFTVSVDGDDVRVAWWSGAYRLGLDHPSLHARGALAGVSAGDTIRLVVSHPRDRWCIAIDGDEDCRVSTGIEEGWALLMDRPSLTARARSAVSLLWALALGGVVGLAVVGIGPAVAAGAATAGVGVVGAFISPDVGADPVAVLLLIAGAALGGVLRPRLVRATARPET